MRTRSVIAATVIGLSLCLSACRCTEPQYLTQADGRALFVWQMERGRPTRFWQYNFDGTKFTVLEFPVPHDVPVGR